jgi:galactokinase
MTLTIKTTDGAAEVQTLFKKHFGFPPTHVICAPGRLEVLGNHTDYNEGLVMSVAVDKYIHLACAPRADGKIELVSSAFPQREIFPANEFEKNPAVPWVDYVKGVLAQLYKRGVHFNGFSAAIYGTIPIGAGMSSSAALEVATALAMRKLYPFSLTEVGAALPPRRNEKGELPMLSREEKLHFARLCRAAENEFVGVQCGILDQISSLFGKAWHVLDIDCRFLTVEHAPLIGEAVIVCDTKVKHALVSGRYNELRQCCEAAAKKLGAKSLRSVELRHLKANRQYLTQREYECAYHVVTEIARVAAGARALRDEDHRQFGEYMFQSHESSRDFFQNSCAELDLLVELARAHPGCLGARLTGGGFGGATINLVSYHQAENFMEQISRRYEERTGGVILPRRTDLTTNSTS